MLLRELMYFEQEGQNRRLSTQHIPGSAPSYGKVCPRVFENGADKMSLEGGVWEIFFESIRIDVLHQIDYGVTFRVIVRLHQIYIKSFSFFIKYIRWHDILPNFNGHAP